MFYDLARAIPSHSRWKDEGIVDAMSALGLLSFFILLSARNILFFC